MKQLKLPFYNWARDAIFSLILAILASLYQLTPQYCWVVYFILLVLAMYFGVSSIFKQIKSSKARVIRFAAKDWERDPSGEWVLTIASEIMLFRVELPEGSGKYQEVMGDVKTSADGTLTFVHFSGSTEPSLLEGRVVIR